MKTIKVYKYIVLVIIVSVVFLISFIINQSGTTVESINIDTINEINDFISEISLSVANEDFTEFTKYLCNKESGLNPLYSCINGYGIDNLSESPGLGCTEEENIRNTRDYFKKIFGEGAWNNVTVSSIYNIYGPGSNIYWLDTRNNTKLTVLEYTEASNQFWADVMTENKLTSRMDNLSDPEVIRVYSEHADILPFKQIREDDPNMFVVRLDFNGLSVASTGEGQFYLTIQKQAGGFRIWQSFQADNPKERNCDKKYNTIIDDEREYELTIGALSNNIKSFDPILLDLVDEFVNILDNNNVDWIYNHITDKSAVWSPNGAINSSIDSRISTAVHAYTDWKNSNTDELSYFAQKIGCMNYSGYYGQKWINTLNNDVVSKEQADLINNEYVAEKCTKFGIACDFSKPNFGFEDDEIAAVIENNILPQFYPVQPFFSYVNPYNLYKITIFRTDEPVTEQKYFSFYISDQNGKLEVISSITYEAIYECSISVQNRGD